ncbi:MAG: iron-sulfur cluster insertion protein ErpA [Alphaproteobacteria bacterium]
MTAVLERSGGQQFRVSDRALARISEILAAEENRGLMLRVSVDGGGCQGFQYGFTLDENRTEDDLVLEQGAAVIIVDTISLDMLNGSELDFKDELGGAFFTVDNPNAASSCGCGTSFSMA